MGAPIPERGQHGDMVGLGPGFLEQLAGGGHDDGVGGEHERGLAVARVVDLGRVHRERFLRGGLEGVFEGGERFGEGFRDGGGDYCEVGEADLFEGGWVDGFFFFFARERERERLGGGGKGEGEWNGMGKNNMCVICTCASNCFRRGEADARITLLLRRAVMTGRSRGSGARGRGGLEGMGFGAWRATS